MNKPASMQGMRGMTVNVNHTDLKGGLITSTQKAEDEGKTDLARARLHIQILKTIQTIAVQALV